MGVWICEEETGEERNRKDCIVLWFWIAMAFGLGIGLDRSEDRRLYN